MCHHGQKKPIEVEIDMAIAAWVRGGLFCLLGSTAFGVESSELPHGIKAPAQAQLIHHSELNQEVRLYPQASLRRISGRLRMQQQVEQLGTLKQWTFQLSELDSVIDIFEQQRQQLLNGAGARLLFWCEGRDCGSSNLWANAIFHQSYLYGPDGGQAYALIQLNTPRPALVALYGITRGDGVGVLHMEVLKPEQQLGVLRPTAGTLYLQLQNQPVLALPELVGKPDVAWVATFVKMLQRDRLLRLVLVGPQADAWYAALVAAGIRPTRLEVDKGAGPGLQLRRLP